jgi:Na+/H+ antiporter NhaC
MPLLSVAAGIALLLALVLVARLDAFFALLLTSFGVGLLNGMSPLEVLGAVTRGVGATMGSVVLVLVFGAMLGKLLDESGAARAIVGRLAAVFGPARVPLAMAATGLLVGLPMLYNAASSCSSRSSTRWGGPPGCRSPRWACRSRRRCRRRTGSCRRTRRPRTWRSRTARA